MPSGTTSPVICLVFGTHEVVNILVDGVGAVAQIRVAFPAEWQFLPDAGRDALIHIDAAWRLSQPFML